MYECVILYILLATIYFLSTVKIWIIAINMFFTILYLVMILLLILFVSIILLYTKRKIILKI